MERQPAAQAAHAQQRADLPGPARFGYLDGRSRMTMTTNAAASSARPRWSMTGDALSGLRAKAEQLAGDAERTGGYVSAHMSGEPDTPTLVPNIDGQRLLRQLNSVRRALALAHVETDARLAVIGRRVTLERPGRESNNLRARHPGRR